MITNRLLLQLMASLIFSFTSLGAKASTREDLSNDRPRISVLPTTAEQDVGPALVSTANNVLITEITKRRKFDVLSGAALKSLLDQARLQQLLGCQNSVETSASSCIQRLGDATHARFIATTTLGRTGDQFVFSLQIIDTVSQRVDLSTLERFPAEEGSLVDGVRRSIDRLMPLPNPARTGAWIATGAAAATAGVGGIMLFRAYDSATESQYARTPAAFASARNAANGAVLGADISLGIAGAAATTAIVLWILSSQGQ